MRRFWKCHIVSKTLVKTILKSDPFCAHWPKIEKHGHKLRSYGLGVLFRCWFLLSRRNRFLQETLHYLNIVRARQALSVIILVPYLLVWQYKLILSLRHRKGN